MIQTITYKGNWQVAGATESYAGTLTFNPVDGAQLEIIGQFSSQWIYTPIPLIHGSTSSGWITLVDTHRSNGQYSHVTQTSISVYKSSLIFVNHSFESIESIAFRAVSFSLFNLLEWIEPRAIKVETLETGYKLEYTRPDPVHFQCFNGCHGSVICSLDGSYRNEQYDIKITQQADIQLHYDQKKGYGDILMDIFVFVRFLTFCTYEQSYPTAIEFADDDLMDEFIESRLKRTMPKKISCFYQNGFYKPSYQQRKWHQHLLPFAKLEGKFADLVPIWFAQAEELVKPIELLLQFLVDKYNFSPDRFIEIAKALEVFHRGQYTTKKTFESRLSEIVKDYAFQYFDHRVADRQLFCQQVVISRNYYTHYDDTLRNRALKGKELFDLTENMKLLLLAAILRNLNIPIKAVEESVQRLIY